MKRRILSLLMCVLLLWPATVLAQTFTEGYFYYEVEDDSITITGYFGRESEVTVPPSIAGLPVSTIAGGVFSGSQSVEKVNLPDTIMTIESGAFGQSQSVVYNSNTDDPVLREPQKTQQPTATARPTNTPVVTGTAAPTPTRAPGSTGGAGGGNPTTAAPTATPVRTQSPMQSGSPVQTNAPGGAQDDFPAVTPTGVPSATPQQTSGSGGTQVRPVSSKAPEATKAADAAGTGEESTGGSPAQPSTGGEALPDAGFEMSELKEDGTVEIVQSATTMPTPTPVPEGEKGPELIVTMDGQPGGLRIGVLIGVVALVVVALAAAVCVILLILRRNRLRRDEEE